MKTISDFNIKISKKTVITLLITAVYALITLIFVAHHEIWSDEAQVWLFLQNHSFTQLFTVFLTKSNQPFLFYALIFPLVKLGFSIASMQIICWTSMCASVFLLWQFSPFNPITKFLITLSSGFLYFFPVIARTYSILPLLLFLLAIIYHKQNKYPITYAIILGCVANTHIIMFCFAGCLFLMFLYENFKRFKIPSNKIIIASMIIFLSLAAVTIQMHNCSATNTYISNPTINFHESYKFIHNFLINIYDNGAIYENSSYKLIGEFINNNNLYIFTNIFVLSIIVSLFVLLYKINIFLFLGCLLSILFQLTAYIVKYPVILPNRLFCSILIVIFYLWLALIYIKENPIRIKNKKLVNYSNIILAALMFITIPNGIRFIISDIRNNYSSGEEMANFIKNNIKKNSSVLLTSKPMCSMSVSYYLNDRDLLFNGKPIKFAPETLKSDDQIDITNFVKNNKDIYLILSGVDNYSFIKKTGLSIIYATKPAIASCEDFILVKIDPAVTKNS